MQDNEEKFTVENHFSFCPFVDQLTKTKSFFFVIICFAPVKFVAFLSFLKSVEFLANVCAGTGVWRELNRSTSKCEPVRSFSMPPNSQ